MVGSEPSEMGGADEPSESELMALAIAEAEQATDDFEYRSM